MVPKEAFPTPARRRAYWSCQVGGWSCYTAVNIVVAGLFQPPTPAIVLSNVLLGTLGLGLTHAYRSFIRRRRWLQRPLPQVVPRVLLASLALAAVLTATMGGIAALASGPATPAGFRTGIAFVMLFNLSATMLLWSLVYIGLHYFWSYREAEVARWRLAAVLKELELETLRTQLNPHFLFNSLNSVRALIAEDPVRAQEVVTRLAGLLRYTLQAGARTTVSLEEELHVVRSYLALEAVRLEARLRYTIEVEAAAWPVPVPPLLVQTLVENGIKHGVARRPGGGCLRITARRDGERLSLRVENTGHLDAGATAGVGLRNTRERLRLLYGEAATLRLAPGGPEVVVAEVALPATIPATQPAAGP
ncbi:histidine kinase [Rhodocaloribacter litoris]|uniref:sensor histidine kinase n=1 Tax=Rhodocaloribacter litoris TaxID=2558931 RepID=UPI0014217140|nr:histidine kinase [Rhodocaloribacter litoris]QXD16901.1 histidine kinase [Rhodocaloribacter litoris]GIV60590.1 MAG: histidine kinase [Rhodothermaceae bacterium]